MKWLKLLPMQVSRSDHLPESQWSQRPRLHNEEAEKFEITSLAISVRYYRKRSSNRRNSKTMGSRWDFPAMGFPKWPVIVAFQNSSGVVWTKRATIKPRNRKWETGIRKRKPESGIRKIETVIRNPESEIRNPESGIRNPESGIRNPETRNRNPESGIRNPQIKENKFLKFAKVILHSFCR